MGRAKLQRQQKQLQPGSYFSIVALLLSCYLPEYCGPYDTFPAGSLQRHLITVIQFSAFAFPKSQEIHANGKPALNVPMPSHVSFVERLLASNS